MKMSRVVFVVVLCTLHQICSGFSTHIICSYKKVYSVPPIDTEIPRLSMSLREGCQPVSSRKSFVTSAPIVIAAAVTFLSHGVSATPVRAPLPFGAADPADKAKLENAAKVLEGMGPKLLDFETWPALIQIISKEPFTKESMDDMFRYAARCLPPNALLGTDAGQWVGLKTEAVDAMDAFSAELIFLQAARAKGETSLDTTDLVNYYDLAKAKTKEFLALYDNVIESKMLPGFRPRS